MSYDLGAEDYLRQQRVSKNMKKRIKIMLVRGMTIQMVLQRLGMDARRCRQYALTVKGKRPSQDDFITYSDVENILRTMMNKEVGKDDWDNVSAFKWMEELQDKEYFTFYDAGDLTAVRTDGTVDRRGEYHGFASKWQIYQLLEYGNTLCIDDTHKVYGNGGYLFILVAKSLKTQAEVPVAFLLMQRLAALTIVNWLEAPKKHIRDKFKRDYSPTVIVLDMGAAEYDALKRVFPNTKIFIVQNELQAILYETDIAEAEHRVELFRIHWSRTPLLRYLEKNYFRVKTMTQHASDGNGDDVHDEANGIDDESEDDTDGDNHEAWHRTLKMHFFRNKQQHRADEVIYILTNDVLTFFEQKDVNAADNVGAPSPEQKQVEAALKKAIMHARLKNRSYASFLRAQSSTAVFVESFERPDTQYEVQLDFSRNSAREINSCSCPIFTNGKICKHIAMVMLDYSRYPVFKRKSTWEPPAWEPEESEPVNNIDTHATEELTISTNDQLQYQIEDIVQFFTTRDPTDPLSGNMTRMLQDLYLEIRKHGYSLAVGSHEGQQNYKKRKQL
ncbi:hypothetical protein BGZ49_005551 [Haplosporangium sp. Z 27]|nr:hypothetical protein BGZ49_005551 [Haplosporangium sp. Z 27]